MPRKSRSYDKHVPAPDPKYGSVKYAKFINYLMERGKKNIARKILYDALDIVTEKMGQTAPTTPSSAKTDATPPSSTSAKATADLRKGGEKTKDASPSSQSSPVSSSAKATADLRKGEEGKQKPQQKLDGRAVFDQALKNVCPIMEIKGRRIGGSNYQVPMEVQEPRKTALGMKWMIAAAATKKGQRMAEKLATEIMDAYNKTGAAIKKREDVHRMAEANKAFAHFARFNRR